MRYGQIVIGPAGSGKSTFCKTVSEYGASSSRLIKVVNLDPAADHFDYTCYADVRNLISLEDVIQDESLCLGPNGGLVFCMEYLAQNLNWLEEELGEGDDDYFLFDCPGQLELYTHAPVMKMIVEELKRMNFSLCAVFTLDTQFLLDVPKFMSGSLAALSAMINLELPHVNVLTKMDLLAESSKRRLEAFIEADPRLAETVEDVDRFSVKYRRLTQSLSSLLENYSLVKYVPLDISDEDTIGDLLLIIDNAVQYGDDLEVRDRLPEMVK
ncbi:GPN loop GTPase 3 [Trichuris trichiura]|uniref:GPN-loop GTPase 3 n=1 Tax=Trichuris trichiura TaxID=36087 RepID=A0A077Z0W5_TRITR|nr:GPN loop GTPase 3 [Trichuris trichiura]